MSALWSSMDDRWKVPDAVWSSGGLVQSLFRLFWVTKLGSIIIQSRIKTSDGDKFPIWVMG